MPIRRPVILLKLLGSRGAVYERLDMQIEIEMKIRNFRAIAECQSPGKTHHHQKISMAYSLMTEKETVTVFFQVKIHRFIGSDDASHCPYVFKISKDRVKKL